MANAGERQLGHYAIIRKLGVGGMGEVYLADDTRLGRKVALKLLPAETTRDEVAKRRLLREARAVAALDHPNVCTVYDVGEHEERLFVAMQYVDGETLGARLARSPLGVKDALDVASQIAAALQEAHSHGIVHRDIKPANVMINSRGQVKVLDFGLAKSLAGSPGRDTTEMLVSRTGAISGTAPYMSPEQIRAEDVDGRSDIFSLGIVLYQIAAGVRPFDRPSPVATITSILFDPPPPLRSSEYLALEPVIHRCLAKRVEDRYQTARELLDDLNRVAAGAAPARPPASEASAARLPASEAPAATQPRRSEPDVEQLVLRGRLQWNKRHPEAVKQGIALFQEAIECDPACASAYAGLADCYTMLAFLQSAPPLDLLSRIKAVASRASQLDPLLPEPHATLGYAAGMFEWDWLAAEREMEESMRLGPQYAWAPHWFGLLLASRGRFDDAIRLTERARELDPLSPIITIAVGLPYHYARRYAEAITHYHKVVETDANFAPAHYYIGLTYEQLGDYERAAHHLDRCSAISGQTPFFLGALGHCHAVRGRRDEALQILAAMRTQTAHRYVSPHNFAIIEFALGQLDEGFAHLDLAFREHSGQLFLLAVEPRFDSVRGDPRFLALAERHGLPSSV